MRLYRFCVSLIAAVAAAPALAADRPPQYIAIAFDNCTELERWKEWSDFAAGMNRDADRVHFTFFVSGANFIADQNKSLYAAPHERRGFSRINFGGTLDDVRSRILFINELHARGHEIASHAVGHFDGRTWSAADWKREFDAFDQAFSQVAANNGLPAEAGFDFPVSEISGFRAPYLAASPGLYATMNGGRFRYHANGGVEPDAWPVKEGKLWRFSLGNIRLAGSRGRTLSMDYNFLVAQSMGLDNPKLRDHYRAQMLDTYLDYFKANYTGNRAPLHIGHHFNDYQRGAYREALKTFARSVCGLPEVRCVSYKMLADILDKQSPDTFAAWQKGDFARAEMPAISPDLLREAPVAAAAPKVR
ncbi:MAG TPA: polysaccharide deacetylase family protein [Pseudorhodoplanes sp.]|nr:polysaccharide deacetylase family protein [Pseudorhodoplanes sp.]